MSKTIEEERDEWLQDHPNAVVIHSWEDKRHKVTVSCRQYDDSLEKDSKGVGNSYEEALLVALRNWESEWGYLDLR